jgi:hypothetical protein
MCRIPLLRLGDRSLSDWAAVLGTPQLEGGWPYTPAGLKPQDPGKWAGASDGTDVPQNEAAVA